MHCNYQPAALCIALDAGHCYRCSVVCLSVCLRVGREREALALQKRLSGGRYR